jgi:hypothetical protein
VNGIKTIGGSVGGLEKRRGSAANKQEQGRKTREKEKKEAIKKEN